jgi:uncharacterized protein YbaP (TraB family)
MSSNSSQLLWKISGRKLKKPSYIFGTYHSNDPRVFKFSDSTYSVLLRAEAIVIEADMYSMFAGLDTRANTPSFEFDAAGTPYTTSKRATKTSYGSEDGRPQFLDLYIQLLAYNLNKKCYTLESIEDQLAAYSLVNKSKLLGISTPTEKISQEKLMEVYLSGNIERIREMMERQLSSTKDGYQWMINERNFIMADGIDTLCKKNSLFIAVGASHLAGPTGILQILKDRGYKVQQVNATYASEPTLAAKEIQKQNSFTYADPAVGISILFGGKPFVKKEENYEEIVYREMGQGNTYLIEIETIGKNYNLAKYVESIFNAPEQTKIQEIRIQNNIKAYEGLAFIYGTGYCWRRVFVYNNKLIKLSCYGGNKFMSTDRYKKFFDRILLF